MLYNKAVYLPPHLVKTLPDHILNVEYCPHAKSKSEERNITLPKHIYGGEIVEIETDQREREIIKAVYRVRYSKKTDLTLVFHVKNGKPFIVRTLWLNVHGREKIINQNRYYNG